MSFGDVSLEDIKQQLQLLGHSVPDDLVNAYLKEVNDSAHAPESYENQVNGQATLADTQTNPDLNSESRARAPTFNINPTNSMIPDEIQTHGDSLDGGGAPAVENICQVCIWDHAGRVGWQTSTHGRHAG